MRLKHALAPAMALIMAVMAAPVTAHAAPDIRIGLDIRTDGKASFQPGEEAGYTVTVENEGMPAWIRIHFECSAHGIEEGFTDDSLSFREGWVKRGSFWYFTESVKKGGRITAVDGLTIPDTDRAGKGAHVSVSVYAEAIQESGIKPDFSKKDPWKGAEADHKTGSGSGGGPGGTGRPAIIPQPGNASGPGGSTGQDAGPGQNTGPGSTQPGPGTADGSGTIQPGPGTADGSGIQPGPGAASGNGSVQTAGRPAADPGTQGGSTGSGNGNNTGSRPPQTGDDFPYGLLITLMALSAAGLSIIVITRKDGGQE